MPIKFHQTKIDSVIYPKFFRGRSGEDDQPWILTRMKVIPESKREEVCEQYVKLFRQVRGGDRKAANTYLNNEAKFYSEKNK